MIQRLVETQKVISLFAGCHETILKSCMQGIMGDVYVDDMEYPHSAFALIGDFCLLAGTPSKELLTFQEQCNNYWETRLLVPQNEDWEQLIRKTYGNHVQEITRYALKKDAHFDKVALSLAISSLSPTYHLREIDEILYHYLKTEIWSRDLVGQFSNYERFRDLGLGFIILKDNEIVSGASSFCRYHNGIEIQVDTKEAFRRRGLAFVCSAKLILTCLQRNLSPSWDAQTEISLHLAQKLGYVLDYPYQSFELRRE